MTHNQSQVFYWVAAEPGISQRDLMQRLKLQDGTISRLCAILSDRGNRDREGLGLIEIKRGVGDDYRKVSLRLTVKGERLLNSLRHILDPDK
jgi:DNA-binding MarR family transcriptional regulator